MPYGLINGLNIHYEVRGSGAPLLMMAPGGFDSTIDKWASSGVWAGMKPLETLTSRYTCIAYDRREAGLSGGRVEQVSLDHLRPRGEGPAGSSGNPTGIRAGWLHGLFHRHSLWCYISRGHAGSAAALASGGRALASERP